MDHGDTFRRPGAFAGEHDILPPGERPADGVVGFAPHDHRVAAGGTLEEPEVLREVPREGVVPADHPLRSHGNDGGKGHGAVE